MTFWLLPRLDRFSQVHPGIRLKLIASNDPRLVRDDDIDVWVTYGVGNWPDRIAELWYEPTLIPMASPALVNSKPLRSIDDLRAHTLLHAMTEPNGIAGSTQQASRSLPAARAMSCPMVTSRSKLRFTAMALRWATV